MEPDDETGLTTEEVLVVNWHMEQMVKGGFNPAEAGRLAALGVAYQDAVALLGRGCPQTLVEEILR